jgi:Zn finger protein HypA/HybF involved in hydrogenase expression
MPTLGQKKLGTVRVTRWALKCERCGHEWETLGDPPVYCAGCHVKNWNVPRGVLRRGRPPQKKADE